MRWPWKHLPPHPTPVPVQAPDLGKAEADLEALVQQRPDVERLRQRLGRHREMNGFAALVFGPTQGGPR